MGWTFKKDIGLWVVHKKQQLRSHVSKKTFRLLRRWKLRKSEGQIPSQDIKSFQTSHCSTCVEMFLCSVALDALKGHSQCMKTRLTTYRCLQWLIWKPLTYWEGNGHQILSPLNLEVAWRVFPTWSLWNRAETKCLGNVHELTVFCGCRGWMEAPGVFEEDEVVGAEELLELGLFLRFWDFSSFFFCFFDVIKSRFLSYSSIDQSLFK